MVSDGPGVTDLLIAATLARLGDSGIVKAGNGVMVLSEQQLHRPTQITAGTLSISTEANLRHPPAGFTTGHLVFNGGTLRVTASMLINAQTGITLIPAATARWKPAADPSWVLRYRRGAGGLTKTGPGELYFNVLETPTRTRARHGRRRIAVAREERSVHRRPAGDRRRAGGGEQRGRYVPSRSDLSTPRRYDQARRNTPCHEGREYRSLTVDDGTC
jgi:hypothetical protein